MSEEKELLMEAAGLKKVYKGRTVVHDVCMRVHRGEVVGLLGPNGAGKTTSFYMIMGLVKPDAGEIFFKGTNISQMPMYMRARMGMGYLAQEPSIFRKRWISPKKNGNSVWKNCSKNWIWHGWPIRKR